MLNPFLDVHFGVVLAAAVSRNEMDEDESSRLSSSAKAEERLRNSAGAGRVRQREREREREREWGGCCLVYSPIGRSMAEMDALWA